MQPKAVNSVEPQKPGNDSFHIQHPGRRQDHGNKAKTMARILLMIGVLNLTDNCKEGREVKIAVSAACNELASKGDLKSAENPNVEGHRV